MKKANSGSHKTGKDIGVKMLNKAKTFFEKHKKASIIIGIIIVIIIYDICHAISVSIENHKDFYIDIQDEFYFDCEATDSGDDSAYCKDRTVDGNFSNYNTVKFDWEFSKFAINGNTFTYKMANPIKTTLYEIDDFDSNNLPREFDVDETLELKNKVLGKTVAIKIITVHYKLTESDIQIITKLHDRWVAKKAEESTSKQADEEAQQEAAPQASEEATAAPAEEQTSAKQDNGEELPDDISPYDIQALCERGFEALGYTKAKISITNHYPMGYPPYIYVIVGTLSTKASITSYRQQVGTVQCQANWSTWTIKSLTINGAQVY